MFCSWSSCFCDQVFSQPHHPTDGEVVSKWRFHFMSDKNVACHWLWHTKSVQYQPITVEENMSPVVLYIRYQRSCILYRDQYWGQYICTEEELYTCTFLSKRINSLLPSQTFSTLRLKVLAQWNWERSQAALQSSLCFEDQLSRVLLRKLIQLHLKEKEL